ncbi:MAG: glycosyl hydrolase family 18 protein [Cellulosilyticaceae bacterium]
MKNWRVIPPILLLVMMLGIGIMWLYVQGPNGTEQGMQIEKVEEGKDAVADGQKEEPNKENTEGVGQMTDADKQEVTDNEGSTQQENNQEMITPEMIEGSSNELVKGDFKVVGYYPAWKPEEAATIPYHQLTHINYSFAIPKSDGTLMPLQNEALAKEIIQKAHQKGVKVLMAVGGWEYEGVPLETAFIEATNTPEKIEKLGDSILEMVDTYGFDGVDMDWEHPRTDGQSKYQYKDLMLYLRSELTKREKLLTSAVVAGVTPDGNVLWDAAGHLDEVLKAVDWLNVMAYDGGDGDRHSGLGFAIQSGLYWRDTRQVPQEKVVLGLPFYGRPGWLTYEEILKEDPSAAEKDIVGNMHYNGLVTIQQKTEWALKEAGGIMIWELTGDSQVKEWSLMQRIEDTIRK